MRRLPPLLIASLCLLLAACSVLPPKDFPLAHHVDLDRYMGAWYVIANMPPSATSNAYDSIERYERIGPNKVKTVFTYRDGGFDAKQQTMLPTGTVIDGTDNAVWAMRFYYVLRLQYVISYVSPDYDTTIVARDKRDFVWIMARTPKISDSKYQSLVKRVADLGYDTSDLRKVPQQALSERHDLHVKQ